MALWDICPGCHLGGTRHRLIGWQGVMATQPPNPWHSWEFLTSTRGCTHGLQLGPLPSEGSIWLKNGTIQGGTIVHRWGHMVMQGVTLPYHHLTTSCPTPPEAPFRPQNMAYFSHYSNMRPKMTCLVSSGKAATQPPGNTSYRRGDQAVQER